MNWFQKEEPQPLDYGLDFYAPQTTNLPDGRRILIAWMKSWDANLIPDEQLWQGIMEVDRTYCGVTKDVVCRRIGKISEEKGTLRLRFIMDRQSIELFVNDGEQVVTTAICTPQEADEIRFFCDGTATVNVEKYEIVL